MNKNKPTLVYAIKIYPNGKTKEHLIIDDEKFCNEGSCDPRSLGRVVGNGGYGIEVINRAEDLSEAAHNAMDLLKAVL